MQPSKSLVYANRASKIRLEIICDMREGEEEEIQEEMQLVYEDLWTAQELCRKAADALEAKQWYAVSEEDLELIAKLRRASE
jgi:hypothetical protein